MTANLVRAELIRLVTRRFTQLMVILLVAAFAVTVATTMATSHRPTAAEQDRAERQAESRRVTVTQLRQECELAHQPGATPEQQLRFQQADCGSFDPGDVDAEDFLSGVFSFSGSIHNLLLFLSAFLALFGFLVGSSFVGADMTSGGMTNLLLWRPQRLLVLGAKLGCVLAGVTALAVTATAFYLGTFWALAEAIGTPGDQGGEFWRDLTAVCLRGIALALVATASGFAVATIGRHTSAAVGLLAGYAVVWELGGRLVMEIVGADRPGRLVLSSYVAAWMAGHVEMWDQDGSYSVQWWHAGLVFVALLAALVGFAFTQFRRRDLA